ncbi:MAG: hypothetical protein ACRDK7_10630, partial [Solirubrobacteraceae bacterium]
MEAQLAEQELALVIDERELAQQCAGHDQGQDGGDIISLVVGVDDAPPARDHQPPPARRSASMATPRFGSSA